MRILNIAGYKFMTLAELPVWQADLLGKCEAWALKGTILLSPEGINVTLAGAPEQIEAFKKYLWQTEHFADINFRESYSTTQPFDRMKVKIKQEIITMRRPEVKPELHRAPSIEPEIFKQWLDEKRDITVLDTRNDYEVQFGTFENATHLEIDDFSEFPEAAVKHITPEKPIVMFCTGGVRCEKAAIHLLNAGYSNVYQLNGGILNYFAKVGGAHYQGECFVFDQRISVDSNLCVTGSQQCPVCDGPVKKQAGEACSTCMSH